MYFIDLEVLAALVKKLKTLCNLGETLTSSPPTSIEKPRSRLEYETSSSRKTIDISDDVDVDKAKFFENRNSYVSCIYCIS